MDLNTHKEEMKQIKEHMKMLNITGGVAIGALLVAGYLMVTTPSFENKSGSKAMKTELVTEAAISPVVITEPERVITTEKNNVTVAENTVDDPKINSSIPAAVKEKSGNLQEELVSFEASCDGGAIVFNWVTMGNARYAYEIEKTYDKQNYEVFSRAPQPEKKDGKNFYAVEEATTKDDDAFYRLRKVVGKNKFEYSEPVNVKCANKINKTEVDVFPNGYGSFRIVINTQAADQFRVSLTDINDTELASDTYETVPGNNEFLLSSSSITKGNYVLRVTNGNMIKEKKVVLK
jgi:hypothetical protein